MYFGLDIGDIFRICSSNEYWGVYPSKSETLDALPIPARRLKTYFFAMEWLAWVGDND